MNFQENPLMRQVATMSPEELRRQFVVSGLFQPGAVNLHWWETDRTVLGAAVPQGTPLALPNDPALRATYFLERREVGIINLGGPAKVTADGQDYVMNPHDAL